MVTLWKSNCPFGFLLVMFPLGSSYFVVVFLSPLRKHAYSNILKISPTKTENFQIKTSDIFFIFLLKI